MNTYVKTSLEEGVIPRDQIATIVYAAAGDARAALSIFRTADRHAHRNYETQISDEIVVDAMPEGRAERHQKDVDTLTPTNEHCRDYRGTRGDLAE